MASAMDVLTQRVNPRLVIFVSVLLALAMPVAFAVQLVGHMLSAEEGVPPMVSSSEGGVVETVDIPPAGTYLEAVRARELFRPPVKKKVRQAKKISIADRAKNFEVIGIIELDKMEAIIKDRKTRQSHYVNEGSTIGDLTVAKIETDKVTLSYEDETHELRMV